MEHFKNSIHIPHLSDGEGQAEANEHEISPDQITDIWVECFTFYLFILNIILLNIIQIRLPSNIRWSKSGSN